MAALPLLRLQHVLLVATWVLHARCQVINISPYNFQFVAADVGSGCLARSATATAPGSAALTFQSCTPRDSPISPEQAWQVAPQTATSALLISPVEPYLCLASASFAAPTTGTPASLQKCNPNRFEQLWILSSANVTSVPNGNSVPIPILINIGVQTGVCLSACNEDPNTACVYNSRDNLTWCSIPNLVNLRLSANGANVKDIIEPAPTNTETTTPEPLPSPTAESSPGTSPRPTSSSLSFTFSPPASTSTTATPIPVSTVETSSPSATENAESEGSHLSTTDIIAIAMSLLLGFLLLALAAAAYLLWKKRRHDAEEAAEAEAEAARDSGSEDSANSEGNDVVGPLAPSKADAHSVETSSADFMSAMSVPYALPAAAAAGAGAVAAASMRPSMGTRTLLINVSDIQDGERVVLAGGSDALGNFDPKKGKKMIQNPRDKSRFAITLPAPNEDTEYNFARVDKEGNVVWREGGNMTMRGSDDSQSVAEEGGAIERYEWQ